MKPLVVTLLSVFIMNLVNGQQQDPKATEVWEPEPKVVSVADKGVPSDAINLLGNDLAEWVSLDGSAAKWDFSNGVATVKAGAGDIKTKKEFGNIQLHIEWRTPSPAKDDGQNRGNSGIFLQQRYELQVLDSYKNRTYSNGQAGAIYKQTPPMVNASKGPGEWQVYDIIFIAPKFTSNGQLESHGRMTVLHNGIVIHHFTKILGTTEYIGAPKIVSHGKGSIQLQDHGNPVSYRNIWVRELPEGD